MSEAMGFEAKTIHRLLEVDPKGGGFRRNIDNRFSELDALASGWNLTLGALV
jgi:hypothetical protein